MIWDDQVDEFVERARHSPNEVNDSVVALVQLLGESPEERDMSTEKIIAGIESIAVEHPEETVLALASIIENEEYQNIPYAPPDLMLEYLTSFIAGIIGVYPESGQHESVKDPLRSISESSNPIVRYYSERALLQIEHPPASQQEQGLLSLLQPAFRDVTAAQNLQVEISREIDETRRQLDDLAEHLEDRIYRQNEKINELEINLNRLDEELDDVRDNLEGVEERAQKVAIEQIDESIANQINQIARDEISEVARAEASDSVDNLVNRQVSEHLSGYVSTDDYQKLYTPIIKTVTGTGAIVGAVLVIVAVLISSIPLIGAFVLTTLFLIYAFRYSQQRGVPQ